MEELVVDTNILIDHLRGYAPARDFIVENRHSTMLSVIATSELYSGYKGAAEKNNIMAIYEYFPKIEVTEDIATEAGKYRNRYPKSHGKGLADYILAVTAARNLATLVTLNKKSYPMLKNNILIPYIKS